ncbi:MAG: ECF transporter S component [Ruminococcus sp.]|nr:ECF transporter S component [Ruminococcus sp.]
MTITGKKNSQPLLFKMVFSAVLIALIILMTFTGIGYIPIGPLKLTLNVLPVAIGAVVLGPVYGTILGLVFGLSSYFTCFGMDALGTLFMSINPFLLFIMCVVPRILCGLLPALVFKLIEKKDKSKIIGSAVSCTLTAVLNTVGFLALMWLFFAPELSSNTAVVEMLGSGVDSIITLFVMFAGVNAIFEALTSLILGSAICKALFAVMKKA